MKIPAKRFKEVYWKSKDVERKAAETERKLNLFKELGADKYYELHPDEAPEGWKPVEEKTLERNEVTEQLGAMIVQGGPHDGKTLNDVWQEDPAYANYLQTQFLTAQHKAQETERQRDESLRQESEKEVNALVSDLANELYGKKADALTPDEEAKIGETVQATLNWMAKTHRGGGVLADAYFLMNKDKILQDAKGKGAKGALENLKKGSAPASIDFGKSGGDGGGFGPYEAMTADQLQVAIDKMETGEYQKFLKDAPVSLRTKYPSVPWN